ncbi:MAG: type II toxin-antitoxin system VapC family toxin [Gammaproteobacteria bacterium]|nr:type II toxin-antitoxin system VapC family toxin [Gammaproteobacteria bacterium]
MRFVLDNSVVMRWLFVDGSRADKEYSIGILSLLEDIENQAVTPSIWPLEVANVLARGESQGLLTEARSAEFSGLLERMAIQVEVDTSAHAVGSIQQLARRFNLSSYDASYLDLALRNGIPLATIDKELMRAAGKTAVKVVSV